MGHALRLTNEERKRLTAIAGGIQWDDNAFLFQASPHRVKRRRKEFITETPITRECPKCGRPRERMTLPKVMFLRPDGTPADVWRCPKCNPVELIPENYREPDTVPVGRSYKIRFRTIEVTVH